MNARDFYIAAFRRRLADAVAYGGSLIIRPGLIGFTARPEPPHGRILVYDDRAIVHLQLGLAGWNVDTVDVMADATATHAFLGDRQWSGDPGVAMVLPQIDPQLASAVTADPDHGLPDGLSLRPVSRHLGEVDGVPLRLAAAASRHFDPEAAAVPEERLIAMLDSAPVQTDFLCAVDADGRVRANAATTVNGIDALVTFVNTDPRYRRRGVGTALTMAALAAAYRRGGRTAYLDSTPMARSMYAALGFEEICTVTRFSSVAHAIPA